MPHAMLIGLRSLLLFISIPILLYFLPEFMFNSLRRTPGIANTASSSTVRNMATKIPNSIHTGPDDSWHGVIDNSSNNPFQPDKGRYHMYIGLFCPFAHRANLVRHLKGLQDIIDISIVKPYPKGNDKGWPGWQFPESNDDYPNATVDKLFGSKYLHEVYFKADKEYKGRYSVPLLWDKKTDTAVNNV
jgi:putative glutathione S-transferase